MAFNQISRTFLKTGNWVWTGIVFGDWRQLDEGAQWIMAHPEMDTGYYPQYGTAQFEVNRFQKRIYFSPETGEQYVNYFCAVTNNGEMDTFFSMQGGGNV